MCVCVYHPVHDERGGLSRCLGSSCTVVLVDQAAKIQGGATVAVMQPGSPPAWKLIRRSTASCACASPTTSFAMIQGLLIRTKQDGTC